MAKGGELVHTARDLSKNFCIIRRICTGTHPTNRMTTARQIEFPPLTARKLHQFVVA